MCVVLSLSLVVNFLRLKLVFKTQDIDIVVSEEGMDPEYIKETIADEDGRYYLKESRKRGATHQILYCRLPGWTADPERCVKVDILVPPRLKIPEITESDAVHIDDIPVMPIFDLLVLKTQGWWDHRNSSRRDFREKESNDVSDVVALLRRAKAKGVSYDDEVDEYRHSQEFMSHALALANRFVMVNGRHRLWRALDFTV
jgi:hypothetical protein